MVVFWVDVFGLQNGIDFEILRIVYLINIVSFVACALVIVF